MKIGHPFKYRWSGRPVLGMLSTPDIYKYKIPVPFAFVPANSSKEARATQNLALKHSNRPLTSAEKPELYSANQFKVSKDCQKMVQNFNSCIRNNNLETCNYYNNYLNSLCKLR